jgi:Zinc finger, C2H2 type
MSGVPTKVFTCPICGKAFDSNQTLEAHKDKDHNIAPESPAGVG